MDRGCTDAWQDIDGQRCIRFNSMQSSWIVESVTKSLLDSCLWILPVRESRLVVRVTLYFHWTEHTRNVATPAGQCGVSAWTRLWWCSQPCGSFAGFCLTAERRDDPSILQPDARARQALLAGGAGRGSCGMRSLRCWDVEVDWIGSSLTKTIFMVPDEDCRYSCMSATPKKCRCIFFLREEKM